MNDHLKQLEPIYQAKEIIKPRRILYRFDNVVSRYYFYFPEGEEEVSYMGATAATDILVPMGQGIPKWYAKNGEAVYVLLRMLAEYGTLMHTEIGLFERNGHKVIWSDVEKFAYETAMSKGFAWVAEEWAYHLPRNLAAWIQFCTEKEVRVLAVEFPVWSDIYYIATLVDIYCELTFGKKRVRAIINLKSNLSDEEDEPKKFYESQDCQLQIEKTLWRECIDLPLDMVFNWSPNNWRDEPTYTLKNWTEKTSWPDERLKDSLPLLKWEFKPPRKTIVLTGEYEDGKDLRECLHLVRMNTEREVLQQSSVTGEEAKALTETLEKSIKKTKTKG